MMDTEKSLAQLVEEDRQQRRAACLEKIQAALAEYGCELSSVPVLVPGQGGFLINARMDVVAV